MHMFAPMPTWPPKYPVLGVGVSATTYDEAVAAILSAAQEGARAVVNAAPVHAVVTAARDPALLARMNSLELVVPDGQPIRWALNLLHDAHLADRVYGPELMLRVCRGAAERGIPVYLYGSTPPVVERLRENLLRWFPALRLAGWEAPPFRPLTPEEDRDVVARINGSGARIVFLGLGCPRQDEFAFAHRPVLDAVQVCVGAAFDFHSGNKRMAPAWMQRRGLEWLFRLASEPRRLWRRYAVTNSIFVARLSRDVARTGLVRLAPARRRQDRARPGARGLEAPRAPGATASGRPAAPVPSGARGGPGATPPP
jgi:exopolysaccharide biosynthesis WecB/TagA/CpsF family protein